MTPKKDKDELAEVFFQGVVYACLTVASMIVFLYVVIDYFWEL